MSNKVRLWVGRIVRKWARSSCHLKRLLLVGYWGCCLNRAALGPLVDWQEWFVVVIIGFR